MPSPAAAGLPTALVLALLAPALCAKATLSNQRLPLDDNGRKVITGEASVLKHGGAYFFYFNNWGDCPGVDCCDSAKGCASCCFNDPPHPMQACSNPYGFNHTIQAYRTADFVTWTDLGVALPIANRAPGIVFRPCVVYNAKTQQFLMWYEDRPDAFTSSSYAVAASPTAGGPFVTKRVNVSMPGGGRVGDFNIFVDDDGEAYHVRTGFDIVRLNAEFDGPVEHVSSFTTPRDSEGPALFKRHGTYYVTAGSGCCACVGGSTIYVLSAPSPKGPWTYRGDVGSVQSRPFDAHSPDNFVTKSQGSAVFGVGEQLVYLGNQWNSGLSESPPGPRKHDLLYFAPLDFEGDGSIAQLEWRDNVTLSW